MSKISQSLPGSTCRKKQGKRLSEIERNEIISLKQNSQLSDMKIAIKYNVDRSTITKIMNKVKRGAMIDHSPSHERAESVTVSKLPLPRLKKKPLFHLSKEEAVYAQKLKLIEDSLSDWRQTTLNGHASFTNDSLKQKALDIFNLLKEKTTTTSKQSSNFNKDWCENDHDNFNNCDENSNSDPLKLENDSYLSLNGTSRKHHNEILNCQYCLEQFDEPKILPCGNTVCIRCINNYLLDNDHITNEFRCIICDEMHDFPKNKCFPTNQVLLKLLNQELNNCINMFSTSFSQCDNTLEKLKTCLKNIQKQKTDLDTYLNKGDEQIRLHCVSIKTNIEQAAESAIQSIHKIKEHLINELEAYQVETVKFYESNKTKSREKFNFKEIYDEIDKFELSYNKYDPLNAIKLAQDLDNRLSSTKIELENLLFNGSFIQFNMSENLIEPNQVGYFSYSDTDSDSNNQNNNHNHIEDSMDNLENNSSSLFFGKLNKTDFNLNKLLEKKTPFQFRSDLNFQILENGNYAISFKDSNDKLYHLAIFSSSFNLIKSISLPLQAQSGLKMFKYRNKILISNSSNWCNRLFIVDEDLVLKSKDFEQDDEVLSLAANENYIFCLLGSSVINFHDWNLEFINSFTPSLDENLPFCVPTDISQLEVIDSKFVFKFENKIRIFDEDGRLLNETFITYDDFIVNHSKNQIIVWNREIHKLFYLDSNGSSLSEVCLQDFNNENLNLFFDSLGNYVFVDLKNFLLFRDF